MPAVPRRGPGTSRYTGPAVHPYCCFQAPVAALPAPFSYTHRPGRSGRHGPAGSGVDFPIPQNSFGCVLPKMGSRACRRAISRHGPGGECRMPEGGLPWTVYPGPPAQNRPPNPSTLDRPPKPVYPGPPAQNRPPNPSTLHRPPKPVYPAPPTKTRLPCTAHPNPSTLDRPPKPVYPGPPAQNRPPNPSTLHRPPKPVYPVPPAGAGLPARLPWTAHQDRPPNPSRLTLLYSTLNDVGLWISLPKPWLQAPFPSEARAKYCRSTKRPTKTPLLLNSSNPTASFLDISTLSSDATVCPYHSRPQRDEFATVRPLYGPASSVVK